MFIFGIQIPDPSLWIYSEEIPPPCNSYGWSGGSMGNISKSPAIREINLEPRGYGWRMDWE